MFEIRFIYILSTALNKKLNISCEPKYFITLNSAIWDYIRLDSRVFKKWLGKTNEFNLGTFD